MGRVPFVASIYCIWYDHLVSIDTYMCYNFWLFCIYLCFILFVANYDLCWEFAWVV